MTDSDKKFIEEKMNEVKVCIEAYQALKPIGKEVLKVILEELKEIEPYFKTFIIDIHIEYVTEAFKKFVEAGFTRQEALLLVLDQKDSLNRLYQEFKVSQRTKKE